MAAVLRKRPCGFCRRWFLPDARLTKLVEHCTSWTEEKRAKWVKRMRRRLKRGQVEVIIKEARRLA